MRDLSDTEAEKRRFRDTVERLGAEGKPVKVHCGFGRNAKEGFLNLDIALKPRARPLMETLGDSIFIFPFADDPWPIPDNSVDFVFHEDFIEHIPQRLQILFLAETLRVLKPGAWHRVNTPCLLASMKRHSDFSKGSAGVYQREWNRWGHVALYTRAHLEEVARLVGYREVVFNLKNQSVSEHKTPEKRPGKDRHPFFGNIFADLMK